VGPTGADGRFALSGTATRDGYHSSTYLAIVGPGDTVDVQ
jgi:hypothetical protein